MGNYSTASEWLQGGPKLHFKDHIRRDLSQCNIPLSDLEPTADNRYGWKSVLLLWSQRTLPGVRPSNRGPTVS